MKFSEFQPLLCHIFFLAGLLPKSGALSTWPCLDFPVGGRLSFPSAKLKSFCLPAYLAWLLFWLDMQQEKTHQNLLSGVEHFDKHSMKTVTLEEKTHLTSTEGIGWRLRCPEIVDAIGGSTVGWSLGSRCCHL